MNALCILALCAAGARQDDKGYVQYTYAAGHLIVSDFSKFSGDGLSASSDTQIDKHAHIDGAPASIELPEKGFTLHGKAIDLIWSQSNPKQIEIKKAYVEGAAVLHFDSAAGFAANTKFTTEKGLPKPKPELVDRIGELTTEVLRYEGNLEAGTITLPGAWSYTQADKGTLDKVEKDKHTPVQFDQTFTITASSGTVHLIKGKSGSVDQIETGTIMGPVHFKLTRHETPSDTGKTTTSTYEGTADRVEIDMRTQPGTITASGHVKVDGGSDGNLMSFANDRVVITVSPELEPISIQMGSGRTTVKPKDGSK